MRSSQARILVSHAGVLPRPADLQDLAAQGPEAAARFEERLPGAVREVVQQQVDCGIDIVNDGEISKRAGFSSYAKERLSGFEERPSDDARMLRNVTARDRQLFPGTFAKGLDVETIQVSIAHAYPGTEFYDYAKVNGFITNERMEDGGGHQMAHIEYPGLPTDYVMEMVHRFYDEYYFRPKAAARVVWKAIVNRDLPRLYVEAKSFLKLRSQRNKMVKEARKAQQSEPPAPVSAGA